MTSCTLQTDLLGDGGWRGNVVPITTVGDNPGNIGATGI